MISDKTLSGSYPILRFFEYGHLPPQLQVLPMSFRDMAYNLARVLPHCPETSTALRKLLEAKDCAVRASLPEETDA